jgi:hypothetical protein
MRGIGTWGFDPRNAIEAIHHYERFTGWRLGELAPNIPAPKSSNASNMLEYLYDMEKKAKTEHAAWVRSGRVGTEPSLAAMVKGWGGWIGEGLCGSNPNATARKDLGFLEVKTFGVTPDWNLREKFLPLTSFTWQRVNDDGFNDIKVKQKITQSLLVPIIKHDAGIGPQATADEIANFMLGPPMVFLPDEHTVQDMQIEYDAVRTLVRAGNHTEVKASTFSHHTWLVPNTAGTNRTARTTYTDAQGNPHTVKQRKWNMPNTGLMKIIQDHR